MDTIDTKTPGSLVLGVLGGSSLRHLIMRDKLELHVQTIRKIGFRSTLALFVALAANSVSAHHSFSAEYDQNKPIKLTGKVTEMLWSNPHAWIHLDVPGKDGKVVNWAFETGGANALYRRGWRRQDLVPGTVLVVDAFQARNGTPTANAVSITFPDGRKLFSGGSAPGANPDTK